MDRARVCFWGEGGGKLCEVTAEVVATLDKSDELPFGAKILDLPADDVKVWQIGPGCKAVLVRTYQVVGNEPGAPAGKRRIRIARWE